MMNNIPATSDPFAGLALTGWYPGHMLKATRQMQQAVSLVDLVVELADARAPAASRNPEIRGLFANKPFLLVANKADLAAPDACRLWAKWFAGQGERAFFLDSRRIANVRSLTELWRRVVHETRAARGATRPLNRPARIMIVGAPNVGKSTLVNHLRQRNQAKVGPKPGVTRQHQWIALDHDIDLLDTPGILWPRVRDKKHELLLALLGIMKDDLIMPTLIAEYFCWEVLRPDRRIAVTWAALGLEAPPRDGHDLLHALARRRGLLLPGGLPDLDRAAIAVIKDFRNARLGRMTFELPPASGSRHEPNPENMNPAKGGGASGAASDAPPC
jgi:ribosome biogenesis GTPase A